MLKLRQAALSFIGYESERCIPILRCGPKANRLDVVEGVKEQLRGPGDRCAGVVAENFPFQARAGL